MSGHGRCSTVIERSALASAGIWPQTSDQESRALLTDRGHANDPQNWNIGDRVWRKPTHVSPGQKLSARNVGPYEIVALKGYKVDLAGIEARQDAPQGVPLAELIPVPFEFEKGSRHGYSRSLGSILRRENQPEPVPGPRGWAGKLTCGSLVAFKTGPRGHSR